ncbi:hypothetical protein NQ318_014255 [Aromia moschata]|uniref:Uncharacterized protein n=1 Tax=Aromia moschata TaxID=1265417 RepID=A0AAV8Z0K5_9CUCU|nr:hypothetical protein NQ318_014255 [Aromia moschata]
MDKSDEMKLRVVVMGWNHPHSIFDRGFVISDTENPRETISEHKISKYGVCELSNETGNVATLRGRDLEVRNSEKSENKFVKLACLWITEVIHVPVRCVQLKELLLLPKVCVKTKEPQLVTEHNNVIFATQRNR